MEVDAKKSAVVAEAQLEKDIQSINAYNDSLRQTNDRVLPILNDVSGLDLGPQPDEWQKWYFDLVGFRLNVAQASDNPTVVENVPLAYEPQPVNIGQMVVPVAMSRISCFGAGTMVRTLTGQQPIEVLKTGDQVLTQNMKTGALGFKSIVSVHHNPPSKTFRVSVGDETVISSEFHRFWKVGKGWVMARELKVGNLIRSLDGPVAISRIEAGKVVPVYNLTVADDADFFVAARGFLVHDNTLPSLREAPFDAVPSVGGGD